MSRHAPTDALVCADCGTSLREPSANGLCGLCTLGEDGAEVQV